MLIKVAIIEDNVVIPEKLVPACLKQGAGIKFSLFPCGRGQGEGENTIHKCHSRSVSERESSRGLKGGVRGKNIKDKDKGRFSLMPAKKSWKRPSLKDACEGL